VESAEASTSTDAGFAVPVVRRPLLGIPQDLVGLGDLLEAVRRPGRDSDPMKLERGFRGFLMSASVASRATPSRT
jgi:hypothetical protein